MNYIDVTLTVLAIVCFIIGWKVRGMYILIIPAALIAGLIVANMEYKGFSGSLKFVTGDTKKQLLAYTLLFIAASTVTVFLFIAIAKLFEFFALTIVDRAFGAVILITIMAFASYFMLINLEKTSMAKNKDFRESLDRSYGFKFTSKYVGFLQKIELSKQLGTFHSLLK
jgi:uncharacterized membrane protein required for colicin V production